MATTAITRYDDGEERTRPRTERTERTDFVKRAITTAQARRAGMIRLAKKIEPKISFQKRGKYLFCYLDIPMNAGFALHFRQVVDLEKIEANLRAGAPGVEGFFSSIFKGIKKAVSVVGKVTGVGKLIGGATKMLMGPIGTMIPGVGTIVGGLKMGKSIATALAAKKAGRPKVAQQALALAAVQGRQYQLSAPQVQQAQAFGRKTFEIIVRPT